MSGTFWRALDVNVKVLLADAKLGPGRATDDLVRSTGGLEGPCLSSC